eukprot:scaffold3161_cov118-Isochrysis_galbana.AAC.7
MRCADLQRLRSGNAMHRRHAPREGHPGAAQDDASLHRSRGEAQKGRHFSGETSKVLTKLTLAPPGICKSQLDGLSQPGGSSGQKPWRPANVAGVR